MMGIDIWEGIKTLGSIPGISNIANSVLGNDKKSSNPLTSSFGMGGIQQRDISYRDKKDKILRQADVFSKMGGVGEGMKRISVPSKVPNAALSNYAKVFQQVMFRNPAAAAAIAASKKQNVKPIDDTLKMSATETASMLNSKAFKG